MNYELVWSTPAGASAGRSGTTAGEVDPCDGACDGECGGRHWWYMHPDRDAACELEAE